MDAAECSLYIFDVIENDWSVLYPLETYFPVRTTCERNIRWTRIATSYVTSYWDVRGTFYMQSTLFENLMRHARSGRPEARSVYKRNVVCYLRAGFNISQSMMLDNVICGSYCHAKRSTWNEKLTWWKRRRESRVYLCDGETIPSLLDETWTKPGLRRRIAKHLRLCPYFGPVQDLSSSRSATLCSHFQHYWDSRPFIRVTHFFWSYEFSKRYRSVCCLAPQVKEMHFFSYCSPAKKMVNPIVWDNRTANQCIGPFVKCWTRSRKRIH